VTGWLRALHCSGARAEFRVGAPQVAGLFVRKCIFPLGMAI
jgi:hypothetical protein